MKPAIRRAAAADMPAIYAIERASFPAPWPKSAFVHELENDLAIFNVVVEGGVVVGYYDLWVAADEAHLLNIVVAAPHRRRGLGTALLDDARAQARRAGCTRIFLEVRAGNAEAKRLYARKGFEYVGRRRKYYADGEDADVMTADL